MGSLEEAGIKDTMTHNYINSTVTDYEEKVQSTIRKIKGRSGGEQERPAREVIFKPRQKGQVRAKQAKTRE